MLHADSVWLHHTCTDGQLTQKFSLHKSLAQLVNIILLYSIEVGWKILKALAHQGSSFKNKGYPLSILVSILVFISACQKDSIEDGKML